MILDMPFLALIIINSNNKNTVKITFQFFLKLFCCFWSALDIWPILSHANSSAASLRYDVIGKSRPFPLFVEVWGKGFKQFSGNRAALIWGGMKCKRSIKCIFSREWVKRYVHWWQNKLKNRSPMMLVLTQQTQALKSWSKKWYANLSSGEYIHGHVNAAKLTLLYPTFPNIVLRNYHKTLISLYKMSAIVMTLNMTMTMNGFGFCSLVSMDNKNSSLVLAKLKIKVKIWKS